MYFNLFGFRQLMIQTYSTLTYKYYSVQSNVYNCSYCVPNFVEHSLKFLFQFFECRHAFFVCSVVLIISIVSSQILYYYCLFILLQCPNHHFGQYLIILLHCRVHIIHIKNIFSIPILEIITYVFLKFPCYVCVYIVRKRNCTIY